MRKIVVLTGAGISAESGINTFRDSNGLWENHEVMDVASPEGWVRDRELVLRFYNDRRRQLKEVVPNEGHLALKRLESAFEVNIITQNVDDLHERGGSTNVMHLHGSLRKVRSIKTGKVYDWTEDLNSGDTCEAGAQMRPHIVWFGEAVPMLDSAAQLVREADIVIIIGTSMQVYPAAGLSNVAKEEALLYYIDPKPSPTVALINNPNATIINANASMGVPALVNQLLQTEKST